LKWKGRRMMRKRRMNLGRKMGSMRIGKSLS
jgi:hypothetical protein